MAGFSKVYCVGNGRTYDGINNVKFLILQGDANRRWLEVCYSAPGLSPIGEIRIIVPAQPDDPDALLDACIAFYPGFFSECPSFGLVSQKLGKATHLDFDLGRKTIPIEWYQLRQEARSKFANLVIFEGALQQPFSSFKEIQESQRIAMNLAH